MKTRNLLSWFVCAALVGGCGDAAEPTTATDAAMTDPSSSGTVTPTSGGTAETGEASSSTGTGGEEVLNCDPWAQDCPSGSKCMAYAEAGSDFFTGTKCTPVDPNPGLAGDACHADGGWSTGVDDCALGHACWNINPETNIGACVPLCTGTMDAYSCPEALDICVFWVPGLAHVCLQGCDPLLQDCPAAQNCGPNWASGGQEFVCLLDWSFDEGQEFDPCDSTNGCDAGLLCFDPDAIECSPDAGCCLAFCDLDNPSCKGEGAVCESFYEPGTAPPEFENIGVCGLPG